MFLSTLSKEHLQRLLQQSRCPHYAAGPDGEIYWASDEFCEWSGFTESELLRLGWINISKNDDSLAADKLAAAEMIQGLRTYYTVQKVIIKKSGIPQWGVVTVHREPEIGELKFMWCHWSPIDGASDSAFSLAMDYQHKLEVRIADMATTIKTMTSQLEYASPFPLLYISVFSPAVKIFFEKNTSSIRAAA